MPRPEVLPCPEPSSQVVTTLATALGQLLVGQVTRTTKEQADASPAESLAVQVTPFVPQGKVLPEDGTQANEAIPHASEALAT